MVFFPHPHAAFCRLRAVFPFRVHGPRGDDLVADSLETTVRGQHLHRTSREFEDVHPRHEARARHVGQRLWFGVSGRQPVRRQPRGATVRAVLLPVAAERGVEDRHSAHAARLVEEDGLRLRVRTQGIRRGGVVVVGVRCVTVCACVPGIDVVECCAMSEQTENCVTFSWFTRLI